MSYENKIILVGGGGHCKVVLSILLENKKYEIVGIFDQQNKIGRKILGIDIKYTDDQLEKVHKKAMNAFVTLGSIGKSEKRIFLFNKLKNIGYTLPIIISKYAVISKETHIGEGTVVMPGAIVNPGAIIGKNCIINTGSIIEHDCIIGDHVHIAPGVTLSGGVRIGNKSHIGTGSSIIQNIKIGKNVIVGAGSVVIKNILDNTKVYGVPAKIH